MLTLCLSAGLPWSTVLVAALHRRVVQASCSPRALQTVFLARRLLRAPDDGKRGEDGAGKVSRLA